MRSVAQAGQSKIKDKWKNLHSVAKKEFTMFKWEVKKTGGGLFPKPSSQAGEKIIEMFEDTPWFSGLQGLETGNNCQ